MATWRAFNWGRVTGTYIDYVLYAYIWYVATEDEANKCLLITYTI